MTFFGVSLKEGKGFKETIGEESILHLTSACLADGKETDEAILYFVNEGKEFPVCCLNTKHRNYPLNFTFGDGAEIELKVKGTGSISISGYREEMIDDMDDEMDSDLEGDMDEEEED
ncbi:putative Nucleoplasmin-like domain [Monocercomonoides exilis]|uniref:putative Nucleoplasmin-like domain n=1 Tax=Monocercomonoides exilis TaxID=2049356 RepID=UPI00355A7ADA|nr:putative Nucleoplasmin-like domain [Monocercomonoides exilis]|eukprot:MONOS_3897.1-p1 / transcript=MONOS_3897.1 / gene=MONOS_3897 / organism=Monocercomonoides_exilis_PA203 / gene_product=unspecified product / transcript_product=unspecified product / location=Mono_scaffold00096:76684-77131(+) / protein_length=117 / sequence_SO=supercontig / SO=protein_coding / is_pseudo=false